MKKSTLLICGIICGYVNNCLGVNAIMWGAGSSFDGCYSVHCMAGDRWYPAVSPSELNCKEYTAMCVDIDQSKVAVSSCYNCAPGYELAKSSRGGITACASEYGGEPDSSVISYEYTYCVKNCLSSNCSSSDWI